MTVAELIGVRREVYSVRETDTTHEVARYLRDKRVRSVGVLDGAGALVGVISQADMSDKVVAEYRCPTIMPASVIMTRDLVTVGPDTTLDECLRFMDQHDIFHLLVVESEGAYLGMVSVSDVLRVVARDERMRADMLEQMVSPSR
ncbi:MAG: CBS domain-containing protein [Acidobacteriota bacterium]